MSKEEFRVGDQAVRLTAKQKVAAKQRTVHIRVNYCERTLSTTFGVDRHESVAFVKKKAAENLTHQLSKHFSNVPFLELDLELTNTFPESTSDKQQIGALGKDINFTFWPVDRRDKDPQQGPNDYPIATEILAGRRQVPVPDQDVNGTGTPGKSGEIKSAKSPTESSEASRTLYSLARRSLLQDAREMAARLTKHESWQALLKTHSQTETVQSALFDALRGETVLEKCLAHEEEVIALLLTSDIDAARIVPDADRESRAALRLIFYWVYTEDATGSPW